MTRISEYPRIPSFQLTDLFIIARESTVENFSATLGDLLSKGFVQTPDGTAVFKLGLDSNGAIVKFTEASGTDLYQHVILPDDASINWDTAERVVGTALLDTARTAITLNVQNLLAGTYHSLFIRKQAAGDLVITLGSQIYKVGDTALNGGVTLSGAADTLFKLEFNKVNGSVLTAVSVQGDVSQAATGITDGDKGSITVSGGGTIWTVNDGAITDPKIVTVSWNKITGKPTTLAGYGITDPIVLTSGSYANPTWLTSLDWNKITNTPTTLSGYGITDQVILSNQIYNNPDWIGSLDYSKITNAPDLIPVTVLNNGTTLTQRDKYNFFNGITAVDDPLNERSDISWGGTLTNNTSVTSTLFSLTFKPNSFVVGSIAGGAGVVYDADYSATYTDRSLIDKAYALSLVGGAALSFTNGLTNTAGVVTLGGTMTTGVSILGNGTNNFTLGLSPSNLVNVISFYSKSFNHYVTAAASDITFRLGQFNDITVQSNFFTSQRGVMSVESNGVSLYTYNPSFVETSFRINSTGTAVIKSNIAGFVGATYSADYSANFVDRSLIDKAYALSLIGGAALSFSNGLTNTAGAVKLGGSLTDNTLITSTDQSMQWQQTTSTSILSTFGLTAQGKWVSSVKNTVNNREGYLEILQGTSPTIYFGVGDNNGTNQAYFTLASDTGLFLVGGDYTGFGGIKYDLNYSASFTARSLVDKAYVDGLVGGAALSFSNGLTNTSGAVKWGGALTGATIITSNGGDQILWNGTWTATANNQYHVRYTGVLTARATIYDTITYYDFTPSLNAGADGQGLVLYSHSGGFNLGAHTGVYVIGWDYSMSVTGTPANHIAIRTRADSGVIIFGGVLPEVGTRLDVRGLGTTTNTILRLADSANTERFKVLDNGEIYGSLINIFGNTTPFSTRIGSQAGNTSGTTGTYSISLGYSANSGTSNIGGGSIAIGQNSKSQYAYDIAIGYFATALSTGAGGAISIGQQAKTQQVGSISIGFEAGNTSGTDNGFGISIGYLANQGTAAIGSGSVAIGNSVEASGNQDIAIGNASVATGTYGIAIGSSASTTTSDMAIAIGRNALSTGQRAYLIGQHTAAITNSTADSFGVAWGATTPDLLFAKTANMYINNTAGGLVLGSNSVTASTKLDVRGLGTTTANTLRLADSANSSRFRWTDAGNMFIEVVPANDDALTQVLVRDGSTGQVKYRAASSIGGGGGTPAGANTEVQINQAGAFGGGKIYAATNSWTFGETSVNQLNIQTSTNIIVEFIGSSTATHTIKGSSVSSQTGSGIRPMLISTSNIGATSSATGGDLTIKTGDGTANNVTVGNIIIATGTPSGTGTHGSVTVKGLSVTLESYNGSTSLIAIIKQTGFGVGTTSPDSWLHGYGSGAEMISKIEVASNHQVSFSLKRSGATGYDIEWKSYVAATSTTYSIWNSSVGTVLTLDTAGTLSLAGDVVAYSSSDERLKDNVVKIYGALETLSNIRGYSFNWNSKQDVYKGRDYGVLAQEVECYYPEMVTTRANGYKAVNYERLIPVLIEAINELKERIK